MSSTDGFVAIPKHILLNTSLNPDSIVLYAHLLHFDRGSKGLGCIAKRATLSRVSGLSLHKLRKAILNLEENGIVSVIRRRNSLTDKIRINPDCRPRLSTASRSKPSSVKVKPKTRTTYGSEKVNSSTIKINNTRQVNKISDVESANSVTETDITEKPTEIISKTGHQSTRVLEPLSIHQPRTKEVRDEIRGCIREAAYQQYFADISVVNEDNECLTLQTPKGNLYKEFILNTFYDDIRKIIGKEVCIVSIEGKKD
jgi:hypothetical protein